jgi:hypothetical protein
MVISGAGSLMDSSFPRTRWRSMPRAASTNAVKQP